MHYVEPSARAYVRPCEVAEGADADHLAALHFLVVVIVARPDPAKALQREPVGRETVAWQTGDDAINGRMQDQIGALGCVGDLFLELVDVFDPGDERCVDLWKVGRLVDDLHVVTFERCHGRAQALAVAPL